MHEGTVGRPASSTSVLATRSPALRSTEDRAPFSIQSRRRLGRVGARVDIEHLDNLVGVTAGGGGPRHTPHHRVAGAGFEIGHLAVRSNGRPSEPATVTAQAGRCCTHHQLFVSPRCQPCMHGHGRELSLSGDDRKPTALLRPQEPRGSSRGLGRHVRTWSDQSRVTVLLAVGSPAAASESKTLPICASVKDVAAK